MLDWDDIEQARKRLDGVAHRTPVLTSHQFDEAAGATVFFKAENLQRGGAFKFRGAYNKIKAETERGPVSAVVAFSSGNHAQAVALVSPPARNPRDGRHADRRPAGEDRRHARLRRRGRPLRPRDPEPRRRRPRRSAANAARCSYRPSTTSSSWRVRRPARWSCFEDVPGPRRGRRPGVGRRPSRRLGDGGEAAPAVDRRSTARSPRPPPTPSSRSRPAAGSKSPRTRRSPTGCA